MTLDIRIPLGGMFAIIGLALTVYGAITAGNSQLYERSLSINVNLWWGIVMLGFGLVMYYFGSRKGDASVHLTQESEAGRLIEECEQRAGLERPE